MKLPVGNSTPRPRQPTIGTYRDYHLDDGYYYVDRYEKDGWVNIIKRLTTETSND